MDITSANSVLMIAVPGLFPVPQQINGFATDSAFDDDAVELAEVMIGVDGKLSAGYVPYLTRMTISLQADSNSGFFFEQWISAQKQQRTILAASGVLLIPSINRKYILGTGVLTGGKIFPGAKKTLQSRDFPITWQDVDPANV